MALFTGIFLVAISFSDKYNGFFNKYFYRLPLDFDVYVLNLFHSFKPQTAKLKTQYVKYLPINFAQMKLIP